MHGGIKVLPRDEGENFQWKEFSFAFGWGKEEKVPVTTITKDSSDDIRFGFCQRQLQSGYQNVPRRLL